MVIMGEVSAGSRMSSATGVDIDLATGNLRVHRNERCRLGVRQERRFRARGAGNVKTTHFLRTDLMNGGSRPWRSSGFQFTPKATLRRSGEGRRRRKRMRDGSTAGRPRLAKNGDIFIEMAKHEHARRQISKDGNS